MHEPGADLLPDGAPFLLPGGSTGCVLVHGFTAMPGEMRWLGEDLASRGNTVVGIRLPGHGTDPADLRTVRVEDWAAAIDDGIALVRCLADRVILIGQSLGGMLALLAASDRTVDGVVGLSVPAEGPDRVGPRWLLRLRSMEHKQVAVDPRFGLRREAGYPAYAALPPVVLAEVQRLGRMMQAALPRVRCPALVVHSTGDDWVGPDHGTRIGASIGSPAFRAEVVEGLEHGMVRDPRRAEVFRIVAAFVASFGRPPSTDPADPAGRHG